jgi:hypothetical protein
MAGRHLVVTLDAHGPSEQFALPDVQPGTEAIARWTGVLPRDFFVLAIPLVPPATPLPMRSPAIIPAIVVSPVNQPA